MPLLDSLNILSLVLLLSSLLTSQASSSPVVNLPDGTTLQGSLEGNIATFKGIPYAEAPVGERRWKAPQQWTNPNPAETFDATKFGHTCVQWLWGDDGLFDEGDEDCLFLNVFVNNSLKDTASLPVAIFVHGGSYITGGTAIPLYDGVDLVEFWAGKAILVTTNYRLNLFGFLGSEELRLEDSVDGSTGNYGLKDQRLIAESFGGNPGHVTIFGESAGAGSMSNHLVAHKSWGLYNAVILESGSFAEWASVTISCAQGNYDRLLEKTGCDTVECMRRLPAKLLKDIGGSNQGSCDYAPVVDGVELTTHPWIALAAGDVADVPILHGTNADEGALFAVLSHQATLDQLHTYWKDYGYTDEEIVQLDTLYVDNVNYPETYLNNSQYWWAGQRALGDDFMTCPAQYASQQFSRLLTERKSSSSTFLYHFEHIPRNQSLSRHVTELQYVFHQKELLTTTREQSMADAMATYWGNFFCSFDPNNMTVGLDFVAPWDPYDYTKDNLLIITNPDDVKMSAYIKREECNFVIPRLDAILRDRFE